LNIALADDGGIAHTIPVFQVAFKWDADDFHIVVRMSAKTHPTLHPVVVQYAQDPEIHAIGVVIACETEAVVAGQPAMLSQSPAIGFV
jgi:hypothetical protein